MGPQVPQYYKVLWYVGYCRVSGPNWCHSCTFGDIDEEATFPSSEACIGCCSNMAPRRSKRRGVSKKTKFERVVGKAVAKAARKQVMKMSPMLYLNKAFGSYISAADFASTQWLIQAPFQDIPLQLMGDPGGIPDKQQRLGAVLHAERLKFGGLLRRLTTPTGHSDVPQVFRVMVVRYIGESDYNVDNSTNNGFDSKNETLHLLKPGEAWITKPYVKN